MMICRNHPVTKEFSLPKTEAGTNRIINLILPAIDELNNKAELIRMGKEYQLEVKLHKYRRINVPSVHVRIHPKKGLRNGRTKHNDAVGSVNQLKDATMRCLSIRYRSTYHSRHTFVC